MQTFCKSRRRFLRTWEVRLWHTSFLRILQYFVQKSQFGFHFTFSVASSQPYLLRAVGTGVTGKLEVREWILPCSFGYICFIAASLFTSVFSPLPSCATPFIPCFYASVLPRLIIPPPRTPLIHSNFLSFFSSCFSIPLHLSLFPIRPNVLLPLPIILLPLPIVLLPLPM